MGLEAIRHLSGVRYAEENPRIVDAADTSIRLDSDWTSFGQVRVLRNLQTNDTVACILDSGLAEDHEAFRDRRIVAARSFVQNEAWDDEFGHGTSVAGELIGRENMTAKFRGLFDMPIAVGRVPDAPGQGTFAALAEGIQWCTDIEARHLVISMSLAASQTSQLV